MAATLSSLSLQATVGIAAVQNRSRLKNKCKPNDMKQNRITSAGHSSNTLVSGRPVRIQRSRQTKQVSPNGLYIKYVGRPSIWGNPFKVTGEDGHWFVVKDDEPLVSFKEKKDAIEQAVMFFEDYIKGSAMNTLIGKNLSCWCKIGDPCHADVLLELANR